MACISFARDYAASYALLLTVSYWFAACDTVCELRLMPSVCVHVALPECITYVCTTTLAGSAVDSWCASSNKTNVSAFTWCCAQDLEAVEDAKRKLADERSGRALPDRFVKVVQMRPA
jgi:hypothetical protein